MNINDNFRKNPKSFSQKDFLSPEKSYSPFYSWVWNAPVTKEETDRQLDEFVRLGIKAFYIIPEPKTFRPASLPTMLEPDYLTEPYFEAYAYALKSAFKRGLIAWIYDEGGWPSGGACGRVLLKHPDLARRGLSKRVLTFKSGESYTPSSDAASAFLANGKMIEKGYIFDSDTEIKEYYSERSYFKWPGIPDYPDLTKAESTDAFMEETFPGYEHTLSEYFGNQITAVFSDEPCAPMPVPFSPEIEAEYERRYGESIRAHLDVLGKICDGLYLPEEDYSVPEESAQAIIKWYDLCSELFCKNYLQREKKWANEHGMSFVGHLNGDDHPRGSIRSGSFHVMRSLRNFDIPAVDAIWRQIFPGDKESVDDIITAENRFFPRYASSAAAQIGVDLSATESFGVYGQGTSYDQMRYTIGFQAIRGINIFNYMVINYGRNRFFMTGERPNFGREFQETTDLKAFNKYSERLAYITSLGERLVSTALYYPMCDIWSGANAKTVCEAYEKAGFELEADGVYFDIIDDDVFDSCDGDMLNEGVISMGKANYKTVVIPPSKYIPDRVVKKLEKFIACGGRVVVVESPLTPEISGAEVVVDCRGKIASGVAIDFSSGNLRTYSKLLENGRLDMVFNQGDSCERVCLSVSEKAPVLVNITSGNIFALKVNNGKAEFDLASGETVGLLYTEEELELETDLANVMTLDGEYRFKKYSQFILGDMEIYRKSFDEDPTSITLGDWREVVGESFSGTGSYITEFARPVSKSKYIKIDLGKVSYSANLFLNGKYLGALIAHPYVIKVDSELIEDMNTLEIRVTNSASNEYKYTKTFEKYAKWQLSPYHDKQMAFCETNLEGGLFGPVKIYY